MLVTRLLFSVLIVCSTVLLGQCQTLKNVPPAKLVKQAKKNTCNLKLKTGIAGKVLELKGNFMPGPGRDNSSKKQAVVRTVVIYPLMTDKDLIAGESENGPMFYKGSKSKAPVAVVQSDKNGCFKAALKPGRYSLFVIENGMLYANILDGDGYLNVFNVQPEEVTPFDVEISWQASF
jgi:hypothetical protein